MKYGKKLRKMAALSEVFEARDWVPYKRLKQMIKNKACSDEEFLEFLLEGVSQVEKKFLEVSETKEKFRAVDIEDELKEYCEANKMAIKKITKKFRKRRGTSFFEEAQAYLENTHLGKIDESDKYNETTKNTKNIQPTAGQFKTSSLNCAAKEFIPHSPPPLPDTPSTLNANAKSFVLSSDVSVFTPGLSAAAPVFVPKESSTSPSLPPPLPVYEQPDCFNIYPDDGKQQPFYFEGEEESLINWGQLSHLVSRTFEDEVQTTNICDTTNRVYDIQFLKSVQGQHTDIHQDILHKPELLSKKCMQNVYFQLLHKLTSSGMMPPMPLNPLLAAPHMTPLGPMGIPPMGMMPPQLLFQMLSGGPEALSMLGFPPNFKVPNNEEPTTENKGSNSKSKKKKKKKAKCTSPNEQKKKPAASPTSTNSKNKDLHKAKNAWSRRTVITKEEELAGRTMQSLLNKLVPEKFDKLVAQALKDTTITQEKTLHEITVRLHKKAISEAKYAPLYTHFVRKLKQSGFKSFKNEEVSTSEKASVTNIEAILLDLCLARLDTKFEPESEDLDNDCKAGIFWKQTLGNYTLLGELYKREITTHDKIMNVIVTLLGLIKNPAEDAIERGKRVEELFHLLKSCGLDFEEKCRKNNHFNNNISAREPTFVDKCFQDLTTISKDETLKVRARFMIQDLIELKNKHWEQRNNPGMCPKFLSEIKADIHKERMQKIRKMAALKNNSGFNCNKRRKAQTPRPRSGPRRKLWAPKSRSDTNLAKKPAAKARSPKIDKIKWASLVKGLVSQEDPQAKTPPKPASVTNAWAKGRPHIRESRSLSPDSSVNTFSSAVTHRSGSVISRTETESVSGESHVEIVDHLFEDAVLEFFDSHDVENACLCIKEAIEQGCLQERFIFSALNASIEKNTVKQKLADKLMITCFKSKACDENSFLQGLSLSLEFLPDWHLDVPRLPEIMAVWLSSWIENGICDLTSLQNLDSTSKTWTKILHKMGSPTVEPIVITGTPTHI